MDVGAAFTYFKRDEQWVNKFLIGSLLLLTIIGIFPVMGWLLEIIRRVSEDDECDTLPEWENFGAYALAGLKLYGVALIWSIPILILALPLSLFSLAPVFISPDNEEAFASMLMLMSMANLCVAPITMILSLGMQLITYPMYGILATTGSFLEALNPVNAFKVMRANPLYYVILILITFGLGYLILPAYLLCITIFPAMIYLYTILGNLTGQAYKRALENMQNQATPPAEPSV
jgi:hypothetical protein